MTILRRAMERRYLPEGTGTDNPWAIPTNGSAGTLSVSGVPISESTAMQLTALFAGVRILSTALAGLPLDAIRMVDFGDAAVRKPIEPPPIIVSDPFGGANNVVYPTRRAAFVQLMVSLLLRGNAYALITAKDFMGRPTKLLVLHPDWVRVTGNPDGSRAYLVNRQPIDPGDMVHLVGMCFPGQPMGMSIISYARQSIGLGLAAEEFGGRFFGSGAHLSGVIEVPLDLKDDAAKRLKENFSSKHSGMVNAHAVGVLTGGATWKPISVTPEDAQFLGTRAAQNLDIAMLLGIPPHMLGQVDRTTSWGTGIEQQSLGFLKYTLSHWVGTFEDAWSAMLPKPQVARFNLDALLRTDTSGRYAVYTQARNAALLTIDEIRAMEDRAPLPNGAGSDPFAPLNSAHTDTPAGDASAGTPKSVAESGAVT